ncbi:MAG: DUF4886 domain-containing protein [Bacteroidales bacterium]|nr:DUF4886 domain-containing protein [Bacteroidales bacterium]
MKKPIAFFFLLIVILFASAQTSKVLFLGNSYTYVNNLPELVSMMISSSDEDFSYQMNAPGGCTFQHHCMVSSSYIQQGGWDYVVLQEQSQLPSFPEDQFMQESYPYAESLCSMIRDYNSDAKIVFYMTWGRKNGDQQNCPYYPPLCTYQGMDSLLNLRYMMMAEDNHASVSPVGTVWHYIRDHYPDLELYQSDESHPSYLGSYIAACCFYTILTGRNPRDITWNGALDENTASIAKYATKTVVFDSLWKWTFDTDTVINDSTAINEFTLSDCIISLYPNPAKNTIHVAISENAIVSSISIADMEGNIVYDHSGVALSKECLNLFDIDISFLKVGNYILSVYSNSNRTSKVFTIIR